MRYARQRDAFSCGPTAVINALKWAGEHVPYRENLKEFRHHCQTTITKGTSDLNLDLALRACGDHLFKTKYVERPTLKQIDDAIRWWDQVILGFYWDKDKMRGHYVTLDDISPCGAKFRSVNLHEVKIANGWFFAPETVWWISRDQLKHIMRHRSTTVAWILRRIDA